MKICIWLAEKINVDGYIGDSTKSEIDYAKKHGKKIEYLVKDYLG